MSETKYGKYILREPRAERWAELPNSISVNSTLNSGINLDFAFLYATKAVVDMPRDQGHPSHKHPVNEFLYFIGGDPTNILDSDFELEIYLGEGKDQERHIVNSTSVVYIPAGLVHLPMRFTKIGKPVLCGHLLTQGEYAETRLA